jgi:tetratricopeptide (TPR) repeat protein
MTISATTSMMTVVSMRRCGGGGSGGSVRRRFVVSAGTTNRNHHHEKLLLSRRTAFVLMTTTTTTFGAVPAPVNASTVTSSLGVSELTRRGMSKFSGGEVEASVEDFDAVVALDARYANLMWQRGLSLYYTGEYDEAAKQFRKDVDVNPNDTEESVWCFASEAMDPNKGLEYARKNQLVTGRDSRRVMASVYALFSGAEDGEEALRRAGKRNSSDEFYSALYLGLWYEINGRAEDAKREIKRANDTLYSRLSGDYMTDVARVHAQRRGW